MSSNIEGTIHGIDATVIKTDPLSPTVRREGIGVARTVMGGQHQFVVSLIHTDGTVMCCMLDERALDRLAHNFAACIEAANRADAEPRFGSNL